MIFAVLFGGAFIFPSNVLEKSLNGTNSNLASAISHIFVQKPYDRCLFIGPNPSVGLSPNFYLVQTVSVKGVCSPANLESKVMGVLIDGTGADFPEQRKEVIEYIAQQGDSLQSIADNFNVSLNTLLWANELTAKSKISTGQSLIVLPVSGVIYEAQGGDSLNKIAKRFKGNAEDIVSFNELADEEDVFAGDFLIIPGGVMPPPQLQIASTPIPLASSFFICPISSPCQISQGLHWSNAIDFTHGKCGEAIFAAAGGEVLRVKYGYNQGAGNNIKIVHPNGITTFYGHIMASFVNTGDKVSQGQLIALIGGKPGTPGAGMSTGCHVHFQVSGARNPFAN